MPDKSFFEELSARLNEILKNSPTRDIEKNIHALLMSGFARLDLITREEFEVQELVLAGARRQLTMLEARVAELEARRDAS